MICTCETSIRETGSTPCVGLACAESPTNTNFRLTPKNIFYRNEVQYRDDVPTKRKVGM